MTEEQRDDLIVELSLYPELPWQSRALVTTADGIRTYMPWWPMGFLPKAAIFM